MLIGLVTKNGILIVEFANQLKERGIPIPEAIREASVSRLRPILMTSFGHRHRRITNCNGIGCSCEK